MKYKIEIGGPSLQKPTFFFSQTLLVLVAAVISQTGCEPIKRPPLNTATPICRGMWTEFDSLGNLKKFNEYERAGQCWTETVALNRLETTEQLWIKNKVTCSRKISG